MGACWDPSAHTRSARPTRDLHVRVQLCPRRVVICVKGQPLHAIANGEERRALHRVGRYEIFDRIAAGGMATVHLARLSGAEGFSRVVAIKRMHPQFLLDPEFKAMFVAESRVAARVRHPNVVPILDVLAENDELVIVMDYVHGESAMALARAARQKATKVPVEIAVSILVGLLHGLHAAHTA